MPTANIRSYATRGVDALRVDIEVHISAGLPAFNIVGMPETAVRESRERVRSAILNSKFEFPSRRITVNLAPADLPKQGGGFDLPIALGVLIATGQLPPNDETHSFCGELSLIGQLRRVKGLLPIALASNLDELGLVCPSDNIRDLELLNKSAIFPATTLLEVCAHIKGQKHILPLKIRTPNEAQQILYSTPQLDLQDVCGQAIPKRALEIAAAGGHNLLFKGPPGAGKSMLAKRIIGILPQLTDQEAIESAVIYSVSGRARDDIFVPPVRAPHHTASSASLVGGGSPPAPGEVSLAHKGVLFLDELPEFAPKVLEALREPMENGEITISRAAQQNLFPANFQLIAAMNPCPCGYFGSPRCDCSPERVIRYQRRVSGPLLDRIDMQVQVELPDPAQLLTKSNRGENSTIVKKRVLKAQDIQIQRQGKTNANLDIVELNRYAPLDRESEQLIQQAMDKLQLSARGLHKVLRVARTVADLEQAVFDTVHIKQALGYRDLTYLK